MLIPIGQAETLREGTELLIVGFGPIVMRGIQVAERLEAAGWSVGVVDARFAKPLDARLITESARGKRLVVTLEESAAAGGFGGAVTQVLEAARLTDDGLRQVSVLPIGIPADRFVDHGSVIDLRRAIRLDADGIQAQVLETLARMGVHPEQPVVAAAARTA